MLVLSRRNGEAIIIDGTIRLTVVEVKGGQVRIGIAAPPSVTVDRKEVQDRKRSHSQRGPSAPAALGESSDCGGEPECHRSGVVHEGE